MRVTIYCTPVVEALIHRHKTGTRDSRKIMQLRRGAPVVVHGFRNEAVCYGERARRTGEPATGLAEANCRRLHSSLDGATPDQAYFTLLPIRTAA
jgi:hypothetical protein